MRNGVVAWWARHAADDYRTHQSIYFEVVVVSMLLCEKEDMLRFAIHL